MVSPIRSLTKRLLRQHLQSIQEISRISLFAHAHFRYIVLLTRDDVAALVNKFLQERVLRVPEDNVRVRKDVPQYVHVIRSRVDANLQIVAIATPVEIVRASDSQVSPQNRGRHKSKDP